ncbi:ileal sodium/bile acid cotransporter-like [Ptychodera flava]|uniref:ileal sodium/bile acid cotransporter-like n=1 Tax=Ptychodera flava TaxID=63121 RepID=UPI003969BF65
MDLVNMTNGTNSTTSPEEELTGVLGTVDLVLTTVTLVVIMIGMGCTQTLNDLGKVLKRPFGIIIGFVVQFFLMPLVGFGLAHAFNLPDALAISVVIVTCCPGGSMSNIFAYWARGDISLSICMTTCSTILAIGMMPLCIFMYSSGWTDEDSKIEIPYVSVATSLATILAPTAVGMLIKWKFSKISEPLTKVCSIFGLIGIFTGIGLRAYANPEVYISTWETWVVAAILPPIGFTLAFLIATSIHFNYSKRRTAGIECGCQNVSLALTIINLSFPPGPLRADMQIIPSIYGPLMGVEAGLFALCCQFYFRVCQTKSKADELDQTKEDIAALYGSNFGTTTDNDEKKLKELEMTGYTNTEVDVSDEKNSGDVVIDNIEENERKEDDTTGNETNSSEVTLQI